MLFWNAVVKKKHLFFCWILPCVTTRHKLRWAQEIWKTKVLTRTMQVKRWIRTSCTFRWCFCHVWEQSRIWVCMPSSVSAVEGAIAKRRNELRPNSCAATSGGCQQKDSAFNSPVCVCVYLQSASVCLSLDGPVLSSVCAKLLNKHTSPLPCLHSVSAIVCCRPSLCFGTVILSSARCAF